MEPPVARPLALSMHFDCRKFLAVETPDKKKEKEHYYLLFISWRVKNRLIPLIRALRESKYCTEYM